MERIQPDTRLLNSHMEWTKMFIDSVMEAVTIKVALLYFIISARRPLPEPSLLALARAKGGDEWHVFGDLLKYVQFCGII